MILSIVFILGGLGALVAGGEWLVRGASNLAAIFKVPPLIVGLTIVAFGTSTPELGVSLQATLSGAADVAVGNVVGSNILNILFNLGLAAIVAPLVVNSQLVRLDVPIMVVFSVSTWLLARDGVIDRSEGATLFGLLIAYLALCTFVARRESKTVLAEFQQEYAPEELERLRLLPQFAWMLVGLVMLGLGSRWLVTGAVAVAQAFGVSELVIGLTVVAAGTSMPEVVTSVVASLRGQRDIAVGNAVGSNIFNLGCVLGLSGLIAPGGIPVDSRAIAADIPIMIGVAAICLPIFFFGGRISRGEGALFVAGFVAYTVYLIGRGG